MLRSKYSIDLQKHMAVCDANYIRLLKLLPQLETYRDKILENSSRRDSCFDTIDNSTKSTEDSQKSLRGLKREFCISDASAIEETVTVELTVLETFKYTNTLQIIQKPALTELIKSPIMLVRIYHDASTAEVISSQGHKNFQARYPIINPKMYHADEKKQVNLFLGEWLSLCLREGRSSKLPLIPVRI